MAAFLYVCSINYCLATAMAYPVAEGVGTGWGEGENAGGFGKSEILKMLLRGLGDEAGLHISCSK